jgi:colanic acid biosynthesis glycosyl transferase WcaI
MINAMPAILFLNRYFAPDHSATSQIASDLAFYLAKLGYQVTAITQRSRHDAPNLSFAPKETIRGVRIIRVWTTSFGREWLPGRLIDFICFYINATVALFAEARRNSIVIAMTDPPLIAVPAGAIARLRGAKLVNWLQDVFPEVAQRLGITKQKSLFRILSALRNHALRRAAVNVVIGNVMATRIHKEAGASRIEVIPNWALEESDEPAPDASSLRKEWNLEECFAVAYSGNMGRVHTLGALLDAARLLMDSPRIKFLFIGDGAQLPSLIARAQALELTNAIFKPLQPRESLRQSLALPDLHVVSLDERMEGLVVPSKFVGVIALGRPVLFLGAKDGEIGTWIARSGCGAVAPSHDSAAIAAIISRLVADRATLASMAASAHNLWRREFRRQNALNSWVRLLNSLDG